MELQSQIFTLTESFQQKNMLFIALFSLNAFEISLSFYFSLIPLILYSVSLQMSVMLSRNWKPTDFGNFGLFSFTQASYHKNSKETGKPWRSTLLSLGENSISMESRTVMLNIHFSHKDAGWHLIKLS